MRTPPSESIENRILLCRGKPVLPASELAALYGLSCSTFLERVQRRGPLPGELAFIADPYEAPAFLRDDARGRPAWLFTEHGALAAAYLLGAGDAVATGIAVLRAFARFRLSNGGQHALDSWPVSDADHPSAP